MKRRLTALLHQHDQRGQSLVELAISLTVMLLLLAGAVTFGMALFSYVAIRDAAGEGALYGSISPYHDDNGNGKYDAGESVNWQAVCDRVKAASSSPVDMSGFPCTHDGASVHSGNNIDVVAADNPCEGTAAAGGANAIRVMVEYDYQIIMPYIGAILNSQTIHLRATVTNTILEPRCPP